MNYNPRTSYHLRVIYGEIIKNIDQRLVYFSVERIITLIKEFEKYTGLMGLRVFKNDPWRDNEDLTGSYELVVLPPSDEIYEVSLDLLVSRPPGVKNDNEVCPNCNFGSGRNRYPG